jgi:hypothetical protein
MSKISYSGESLEISEAMLRVIRGMGIDFYQRYPSYEYYAGRRWRNGMDNYSIHYVKTSFIGLGTGVGFIAYDLRIALLSNRNQSLPRGLPVFQCSVWYRVGTVRRMHSEPVHYDPAIDHACYHFALSSPTMHGFDPNQDFSDLEMMRRDHPPQPIRFSSKLLTTRPP